MPEAVIDADVLNSPVLPLLLDLESAGVQVRMQDGRVHFSPAERVTAEQRRTLSAHASAVRLLVLIATETEVQARRDVFRAQMLRQSPNSVPLLVFRRGTAYVPGVCYSCGDALPRPRPGRCWRCALASRLACWAPVPGDLLVAMDEARVA
jgi:hypothetical protein